MTGLVLIGPSTMIFRFLFLLLITLGSAANADMDFQDGELLSNSGAESNSVVLASEPQSVTDEFVLAATEPLYAVGSSESSLIKGNNECPQNPAQSSPKLRSKRESRICYPSTRNSPPSVQGSGQNPSKEDPQDYRESTKKDPQGNAQPNRNSGPAKETDCATIPSAAIPVCAVVSEDHIRLGLVFPMSGLSAGWWQLEYSRGGTYTPTYSRSEPGLCSHSPGAKILRCRLTPHINLSHAGLLPGGG